MDREILLDYIRNGITIPERIAIIKEYCINNGKEEVLTNSFIQALIQIDLAGSVLVSLSDYIIEKEMVQHEVVKIYNNNQLINVL